MGNHEELCTDDSKLSSSIGTDSAPPPKNLFVARQDERLDPYVEETVQRSRQRELSKILESPGRTRAERSSLPVSGWAAATSHLTLKQVGEEMGVTKERIRQLEARALSKLRDAADEANIDVELGS